MHAPGHIRRAFEDYIEDWDTEGEEDQIHVEELIGKLWNCTDIMPKSLCERLDVPRGATYAQGVRRFRDFDLPGIQEGR